MTRADGPAPVAVVGAGPVGLTLALALAGCGIPCVVVEARTDPHRAGSRSICVQRYSLALLDRIGAGSAVADAGVSWTLGRTYFRRRELFSTRLTAEPGERFPAFVNIPQWQVEDILRQAVARNSLISLRRGCRLVDLSADGDGVTLTVDSGRLETMRAAYLVGCDGGRSTVRARLGLDFPGHDYPDRFLIADIRADLGWPNERRFYFDPPWNPGRQVLVHPQPDSVWRIDWQVPADVDLEAETRSGRLDERIQALVGSSDYEIVWVSSYQFSQRLAARFRSGRVFLAGDAAHVMSPFGARGLNSGIQDAVNLAWKLAFVLTGVAAPSLLDTYEAERRPAAQENLAITDATMRFMVPSSRARRWRRDLLLRLSVPLPAVRRHIDSGRLSTPVGYSSDLIQPSPGRAGLAAPGAVAPDATVTPAGEPGRRVSLLDHGWPGFVVLYLAGDSAAAESFDRTAIGTNGDPPGRIVTVVPGDVDAVRPGLLVDDRGDVAARYGPFTNQLYLIRPDGYLAARPGRGVDLSDLLRRSCHGLPALCPTGIELHDDREASASRVGGHGHRR